MRAREIAEYLDKVLRTKEIPDSSLNGLILDNSHDIRRIGLAVDFNIPSIKKGVEENVDMIIFHHGPYWGTPLPLVGALYERFKLLFQNDIAAYVSHLPLDMHPEFGNNAYAMKLLGIEEHTEFGEYHGIKIGREFVFKKPKKLEDFISLLEEKIGKVILHWDFGKREITKGAFVSGDAVSTLSEAIEKGLDVLVVGEPRHYAYSVANDGKINVIFLGHYQSETLGLRAIAEHLKEKFSLDYVFLPAPTGL
ncbi:MAG: Nif3-like dinuclear metal center hexameric protein [bacterium]|nr:Nif3-like dinuclear metal center hexameric protein [bacterium]